MARLIRVSSIPATFRRGGMAFTSDPRPLPDAISERQLLALLEEPNLLVEASDDGETWIAAPPEAAEQLRAALAANEIPSESAGGEAGQPADSPAPAPAAGGGGLSAGLDATGQTGGDPIQSLGAEDKNGGADQAPAPVAAKPAGRKRQG